MDAETVNKIDWGKLSMAIAVSKAGPFAQSNRAKSRQRLSRN